MVTNHVFDSSEQQMQTKKISRYGGMFEKNYGCFGMAVIKTLEFTHEN